MARLFTTLVQVFCLAALVTGCADKERQKVGRPKRGAGGGQSKPGKPDNLLSNFSLVAANSIPAQLTLLNWLQSLPAVEQGSCWQKSSGRLALDCPLTRQRGIGLRGELRMVQSTPLKITGELELQFFNGNEIRRAEIDVESLALSPVSDSGGRRFTVDFKQKASARVLVGDRNSETRTVHTHSKATVEVANEQYRILAFETETARVTSRLRKGQTQPPDPAIYSVRNLSPLELGSCFMPTGVFHIEGNTQAPMEFASQAGQAITSRGGRRPARYAWPVCGKEPELFPFQIWVSIFNQGSF